MKPRLEFRNDRLVLVNPRTHEPIAPTDHAGSLAKRTTSGGGYGFLLVLGALVVLLAVLMAGCVHPYVSEVGRG